MSARRNTFILAIIGISLVSSVLAGAASQAPKLYTVQPGDTLYRIAQKYSISSEELQRSNQLGSSNLKVGQVLTLPSNAQPKPLLHTVKVGETLYAISRQYGVSTDAILNHNKLSPNQATLKVGQVLNIPEATRVVVPAPPTPAKPVLVSKPTTPSVPNPSPNGSSTPKPAMAPPSKPVVKPATPETTAKPTPVKPTQPVATQPVATQATAVQAAKPTTKPDLTKPPTKPDPSKSPPATKPATPKPVQPNITGARPLPSTPDQQPTTTETIPAINTEPVPSSIDTDASAPVNGTVISPIKSGPTNTSTPTTDSSPTILANNPAGAVHVPITVVNQAPLPDLGAFPGSIEPNRPAPITETTDSNPVGTLEYTVSNGDTLYRIGLRYGISVETIRDINKLETDILEVGQKLNIPNTSPSNPSSNPASVPTPTNTDLGVPTNNLRSIAESYLGINYVFGGTSRAGLDCSGFVYLVFQELGLKLPRTSREQYKIGIVIEREDLREGDLVFFNTTGQGVSHVGIYLSDDEFINAASNPGKVIISSLNERYWNDRYLGARRVTMPTNPAATPELR